MKSLLGIDEFICSKFDALRTYCSDDVWLFMFGFAMGLTIITAIFGGPLTFIVWVFNVYYYTFKVGFWEAITSSSAYNPKRDVWGAVLRLVTLVLVVLGIVINAMSVVFFAIALYVASTHKIPPKVKAPKFAPVFQA